MEMDRTMNVIAVVLYNLAVLAGTIYVIITYGWSQWWLLLALFACMGCEKVKCKCECKYEPPKKDEKRIIVNETRI
jgi:hypothetical protein